MASDKELILQAWFQASNEALYWNEWTNNHNTEITKQLLGIAALLIPLIGSVVVTPVHLNDTLKMLISISIVLLFISILCGFMDINTGLKFFRKYAHYNVERAQNYHSMLNATLDEAEDKNASLQPLPLYSESTFSTLQIVSVSLGILLTIVVIITLLIIK